MRYREKNAKKGLDHDMFDVLDEHASYWLGFLAADGCVTDTDRIQLSLAVTDLNHIYKLKSWLDAEHVVTFHPKTNSARLIFTSHKIAQILSSFGIVPRKSKTLTIHESLVTNRDFWRGVIDGDGYLRNIVRKRTKNSKTNVVHDVGINLVGSESLVSQFIYFCKSFTETTAVPREHNGAFTVEISGKYCRKILETLYTDSSIYLQRKFETASDIIAGVKPGLNMVVV